MARSRDLARALFRLAPGAFLVCMYVYLCNYTHLCLSLSLYIYIYTYSYIGSCRDIEEYIGKIRYAGDRKRRVPFWELVP